MSSISRFGDTDEDEKEDAQSPNHCQLEGPNVRRSKLDKIQMGQNMITSMVSMY